MTAPIRLAIVGRPNVGKSTLFNRLVGKKLAIVDDRPGVTRDRREAAGRLGDLDLEVIDTAGFENVADESLEARMRAQTEVAIGDADVCLFLIDARAGVTPVDEVFADLLRKSGKPVVLGANKAEGRAGEDGLLEAYALGLGEPIGLSGEHGEGMADLYAALLAALGEPMAEDEPAPSEDSPPLRIAVIGRPNAGKSTLVNALIGDDRLLTGPEAGITRDAISVDWEWRGRRIRLVDTAGMRRKAKVQEKLESLSVADTIRAIRFAEVCLLVMDADEAFEKQDLQIADLVAREGRALVFVPAKWDKVSDPKERLAAYRARADVTLPQLKGAPLAPISAHSGKGLDALLETVVEVHGDWNARVKTRDLNDWLKEMVTRQPPPAVDGKRIKPRYIAQIKARPPTFVLICSRAGHLPDSYVRYLTNGIRHAFDLPAVPIRFFVRAPKNPYDTGEDDGSGRARRASKPAGSRSQAAKPAVSRKTTRPA
jgi:GTPase